jgi:6-phosphogluconolactonase (cycloisomerase 2 family)
MPAARRCAVLEGRFPRRRVSARTRVAAGAALLLMLSAAASASATARPRALYVTNAERSPSSVSAYAISFADGSLSQLGTGPFSGTAGGSNSVASVLSPDGAYLYTVNAGSDTVDVFTVNSDGTLSTTTAAGTPSLAVASMMGIAISPDGSHVYAVGNDGQHPKPCGGASQPACTPNTTTTVVVDYARDAATGALTLNRITSDGAHRSYHNPDQLAIAVAPDGKNVFVATYYSNQISNFPVGATGLGSPTNVSSGSGPFGLALTPSGNALYVADAGAPNTTGANVSYYPLSAGVLGSPLDVPSGGDNPAAVAVSPDGAQLYVANEGDGTTNDQPNVATFAIHPDGTLGATPTTAPDTAATSLPGGGYPQSLVVAPDGRHVYAGNIAGTAPTGNVQVFSVGSGGVLTTASSGASGTIPYLAALVISPDQGPTAALAAPSGAKAETPVTFDASGSSDSGDVGGSVARYDWDFGDGTTAVDAGPTPTHTYHQTGPVTVRVTVTDNEGCSTSLRYTGMSVSCNGSGAATTTQAFSLAKPVAPSCPGNSASTPFNTPVNVTLSCSGAGTLTYSTSASGPQRGTATISGSTLHYTPNSGASGIDTFTVTAADGYGQSASDTVSISIGAAPAGGGGVAPVHYDLEGVRLIVPNGVVRLGSHQRMLKIPLQNTIPLTVNGTATAFARDTGVQIASNAIYVAGATTRTLYLTLSHAALTRLRARHDFAINIVLALADPVGEHASVTGHYLLASSRARGGRCRSSTCSRGS